MQPTALPANSQECHSAMRSVRDSLDLLGGKWKLPIILSLSEEPKRFKQLQRDVAGITAKMLSKELKELEINGLISRHVETHASPVAVTYTLEAYGRTLYPLLEALRVWGQQHRRHIMHPETARAAEAADWPSAASA